MGSPHLPQETLGCASLGAGILANGRNSGYSVDEGPGTRQELKRIFPERTGRPSQPFPQSSKKPKFTVNSR